MAGTDNPPRTPVQGGEGQQKPTAGAGRSASPSVSGFQVMGKRLKGPNQLSRLFAELSFLEMTVEDDALVVLNVESRDLRKEPALFSIVYFEPSRIRVAYTCLPNMGPKKRTIEVLRHFLNLLTLAEGCYDISHAQLYQLMESAISGMTEYVSTDYDRLFSLYDNLKTEVSSLQKKVRDLSEGNASLSKENYDLKTKNDDLLLKVKALESLSDSVLAIKIQDWLSQHKGEINISDFSRVYGVPETRVEQMLNKLVTEGFLATKG